VVRSDEYVYRAFLNVLGFARTSLDIGHNDGFVLATKRFPELSEQQDAVVAEMAAEMDRRTAA
jgi:hypothetical protein